MTRALHNLVRDVAKQARFGTPYGADVTHVKKMSDKELAQRTRALRAKKATTP